MRSPWGLLKRAKGWLLLVAAAGAVGVAGQDVLQFHRALTSGGNQWHSGRGWAQPYTAWRLSLAPNTEYWTTIEFGTQRIRVREHTVGATKFWTVIERGTRTSP